MRRPFRADNSIDSGESSWHLSYPVGDVFAHEYRNAEVVKLVDALRSGRSSRKGVGVRVPPSALTSPVFPSLPLSPVCFMSPVLSNIHGCVYVSDRLSSP